MKNRSLPLILSGLFLLTFSSFYAQVPNEKETRKSWAKMDSAEIASLPDSIKQLPKKLFPTANSITWIVTGLYDPTIFQKYKRPVMPTSSYYWPDTNYTKAKKDDKIWYTCFASNTTLKEPNDLVGKLIYCRPKDSKVVSFDKSFHYYRKDELVKVISPDVLKKIEKELKLQADEEISSISIIEHKEPCIYSAQYSGEKEKNWTGNKMIGETAVYDVYGTKSNGQFADCYFTLTGDYIPNYKRDKCCNKTIKIKGK
jgi:hypothetical protein